MKKIKLITFDLDDTLWDNVPTIKKAEAPVECIYLINHPRFTSRIINSTESNASLASGL